MTHFSPCRQTFNRPIATSGLQWKTTNVADMSNMFQSNVVFNQDISNWDVSSVTDFSFMFYEAYSFYKNLCSWNIDVIGDNVLLMFNSALSCPSQADPTGISGGDFCEIGCG
jgi:surface protein